MKKIIAIVIIVLMLSPSLSNATSFKEDTALINESHIITNVPFVDQDNRFYCTISCLTMILHYYGVNLTRYEVFYLMGGGFSLHWHERSYLNPYTSIGCSTRPSNYEYVASLLNLSFQPFYAELSEDEDKVWDQVWKCILENVSKNQPVLFNLDEVTLFIAKNEMNFITS